jgi:hopanoid-associated phosphorylase
VQDRGFVIAATGLKAEARVAARSEGVRAIAGGGDETRLAALIEQAVADGARGIISFGIAGGLRPGLASGACVVGTSAVIDGRPYPTDEAWTERIAAHLSDAKRGPIAGSRMPVGSSEAKTALYNTTRAIVVDMESQIVARIANARGLPFAILRVVADTAEQQLPPAALHGMKPDGSPDIVGVLKSLASEPRQLADLIRTAAAARRAMAGLLRCHRLLGPGLGFADLG